MFFMIGVTDGQKELNYTQIGACGLCGRYTRASVYMVYTQLLLFFIPTLKWNRRYYVRYDCCGGVMELDPAIGERIARGEQVEIRPEHLRAMNGYRPGRTCGSCGYTTQEDFDYCPKCGHKL